MPDTDTDFDSLPMFDTEFVDRLRDAIGEEELLNLMAFLPEEGRRVLNELHHARKSGDLKQVMVSTHGLKGGAGNFGITRLQSIARAMNDDDANLEDLEKLAVHLERCIADLDAFLDAEQP